jgi:hypothetical protein
MACVDLDLLKIYCRFKSQFVCVIEHPVFVVPRCRLVSFLGFEKLVIVKPLLDVECDRLRDHALAIQAER